MAPLKYALMQVLIDTRFKTKPEIGIFGVLKYMYKYTSPDNTGGDRSILIWAFDLCGGGTILPQIVEYVQKYDEKLKVKNRWPAEKYIASAFLQSEYYRDKEKEKIAKRQNENNIKI